jgi:hypothetical protein
MELKNMTITQRQRHRIAAQDAEIERLTGLYRQAVADLQRPPDATAEDEAVADEMERLRAENADLRTKLDAAQAEREAIAKALNEAGIEHSGHVAQVERVKMLAERDKDRGHGIVKRQLIIQDLREKNEAAQAELHDLRINQGRGWQPSAEMWASVPANAAWIVGTSDGLLDAWVDEPMLFSNEWWKKSGNRWHVGAELPLGVDWRQAKWKRLASTTEK